MEQLARIFLQMTPNSKSSSCASLWADQQKLTVRREMNHKPSIVSQVENFRILLSNENIVTRLISYVVPEWQKSKCVNSLLTLSEFLCVCVWLQLRFQQGCFHIEATLTSTFKCLLWPIHVQVPENERRHAHSPPCTVW